uniref:DoxX family protein n=1 Tax=Acidicaldus sp. TaxID=1872105 RepID=A0A8J4H986_9PROT
MRDGVDLVGRVLIAVLFIWSGVGKIENPAGTMQFIALAGLPVPMAAYVVALLVEVGGGVLLLLGWQTRLVASVMALFTLAAALGFHTHFADHNQQIHFMKNLAIMGGLLHVAAFGAGVFSLDQRANRAASPLHGTL